MRQACVSARYDHRARPVRAGIARRSAGLPAGRSPRPRPPPRRGTPPRPAPRRAAPPRPLRCGAGMASAPPMPMRGAAMTPPSISQHRQRHRHRIIAGAAAELGKAEACAGRQDRQPRLGEQFVGYERGLHGALEEVAAPRCGRSPRVLTATSSASKRRRDQAPFRRRVGMRKAAAERAAQPDRIMRDMTDHSGQHRAERAAALPDDGRRRGAPARRCAALPSRDGKPVEPGDGVDVDQMRRPRQAESHDRHQALPARQHPAVLRRQFGEQPHRLRAASRGGDRRKARVSPPHYSRRGRSSSVMMPSRSDGEGWRRWR